MCESIGHRPLRGRCPKGDDRATNLPTNGRTMRVGMGLESSISFLAKISTLDPGLLDEDSSID